MRKDVYDLKMLFNDFRRPVIDLELHINEETRIIHIMDMSHDPAALSQILDESFELRILNRLGEPSEPADWKWLYYHLDGLVTEHRDNTMNIIRNDPRLHEDFTRIMQERLSAWLGPEEGNVS